MKDIEEFNLQEIRIQHLTQMYRSVSYYIDICTYISYED